MSFWKTLFGGGREAGPHRASFTRSNRGQGLTEFNRERARVYAR
jgi:hypothetical protein